MSLRDVLEEAAGNEGCSLQELTVLANKNDPFRCDTPAGHRDGQWFAQQLEAVAKAQGLGHLPIHIRGVHYGIIKNLGEVVKPNGTPYTNTDEDSQWLSEKAAKRARWLGYVSFERIVDERNAEPITKITEWPFPHPWISVGLDVELPDLNDLDPTIYLSSFHGVQPFRIVLFGEKSSLRQVLEPLSHDFGADLYLPTGEISDTQVYQMAASYDGRPLVVLTFSDCDPAGWQMPISIARKLQALKALEFPELEFRVYRVALTVEQVGKYGLPSTPLKEKEKRAGKWRQQMGIQQTEVDALLTDRALFRQIAEDAIYPFYDTSLSRRVQEAEQAWTEQAQAAIDANLEDDEARQELLLQAEEQLEAMREKIEELNQTMQLDPGDVELPPIPPIPEPQVVGENGAPLVDSEQSFAEQCRTLKRSRAYEVER